MREKLSLQERKLLEHHETELCSPSHRFGPTIRIELGENGGDMKLSGVDRFRCRCSLHKLPSMRPRAGPLRGPGPDSRYSAFARGHLANKLVSQFQRRQLHEFGQ